MKLLFDFFPILLFFIAFKFFGIYTATAVAMAASVLQVAVYWIKHKHVETLHIITLVCVLFLGGATLILHNPLFIKWKPTIIYWAFAIVFLLSQYIGKKPLIRRMMEEKIELPTKTWQRINISWCLFFSVMGFVNLYVAYFFSTNTWVDFKLFGTLALTILFIIFQSIYITKRAQLLNSTEKSS